MGLRIRTAGPHDLAFLQTVFRRSALSNDGDREALLDHPEYLVLPTEPVREGRTRLAEHPSGEIVGFVTVERFAEGAELIDLFVDPEWMRRGIGRALIMDAATELAESGIRDLWVSANPHAIAFYVALGFEAIDPAVTPLGPGIRMRLHCDV